MPALERDDFLAFAGRLSEAIGELIGEIRSLRAELQEFRGLTQSDMVDVKQAATTIEIKVPPVEQIGRVAVRNRRLRGGV